MAFVSKKVTASGDVPAYMNDLDERVKSGFDTVIETGTNSRGTYVKFSDGTMICYRETSINLVNDVSTVSLPENFIGNGAGSMTINSGTSNRTTALNRGAGYLRVTSTSWIWYAGVDGFTDTITISLFAIGRWKV